MFLRRSHHWLVVLFVLVVAALGFKFFHVSPVKAQESFAALEQDIRWLRDNEDTNAVLLFNVWGDNAGWVKHRLSQNQVARICGGRGLCDKIGVNYALPFGTNPDDVNFDNSEDAGMNWALMIADGADPQAVIRTVLAHDVEWIVRFGVGSDGLNIKSEYNMIDFLANVGNQINGKTIYAIAGPNEPDLESWSYDNSVYLPAYGNEECHTFNPQWEQKDKDKWYGCVAPRIAKFMNNVCDAKNNGTIPANVELLTPAFNGTSETFVPLIEALKASGARFNDRCFSGMALNIYPDHQSVVAHWEQNNISGYSSEFGLPIFVTETGPINQSFDDKDSDTGDFRENPGGADRETPSGISNYVSPILGLWPPASRNVKVIRDSLANQGYQAYCATPQYTIEPKFGGDIEDFIDNVRAGLLPGREVQVDSSEFVNYSAAETPIFRDLERKYTLKSDLEEYYGYSELGETQYGRTEVKSAAVTSLLTSNQKCTKTVDTLFAQRDMCNKLIFQPELNCALFTNTISGTNYTVLQLLQEYENYAGGQDKKEVCSEIVAGTNVSEDFRYAMLNAPYSIEKAYRIAYLVGVVEQKPVTRSTLFNFFSHSDQAQPRDEVVVLTFKIPDIGTNKGSIWETDQQLNAAGEPLYDIVKRDDTGKRVEAVESGHTYWDDVMTLTRNVLIPRKLAEKMDLDGSKERDKMRAAAEAATSQNGSSLIYCLNGQAPFGQGSETCNNEDVKAVTDIINGTWIYDKDRISCDKLSFEQTDTIGDSAYLGPVSDMNNFYPKYGEHILDNIWSNNSTNPPFQTVFQVYGDTWPPKDCTPLGQGKGSAGDCTTINFYLVYPMGYDTETLEYVLARTFLTEEQFKNFENDPDIKERFNIFKDRRELRAETNEEQFIDCLHTEVDEYGNRYCPEKEFTASLKSSQGPALFFGARLGYWTHKIQLSFNRLESLAHKYLEGCRTTEEFLLDQCGGPPTAEEFDQKSYCEANPQNTRIVRGVTEKDLDMFKFYSKYVGPEQPDSLENVRITDEQNSILAQEGESSCTLNMAVRFVDGLTLILSGGVDIIPKNPGNILGCTGTYSATKRAEIRRLPPDYKAELKAADPNWKPSASDEAWDDAETLVTDGRSASEVQYAIRLRPGYYKVDAIVKHSICQSDTIKVMDGNSTRTKGTELGDDGYVVDFVNTEKCKEQACIDINLQSNMEGGGPVYGVDDEGNTIILYTIDSANDYLKDSIGCELSFDYSTLKYNNTCGGGRLGDCLIEGGDCGYWSDFQSRLEKGSSEIMRKGRDAYRAVFGRLPNASGKISCTHKHGGYDHSPLFVNTVVTYDCATYANSLDSLRVFQKLVGFEINWFETGLPFRFKIPPLDVWTGIKKASAKHGCDPWLVLAVASSEGQEPAYANRTTPTQNDTVGMFEFNPTVWQEWQTPNNTNDPQCTWRQPPSFTEANRQGLNFSDRANIEAAVDSACRLILYTGMQKYPEDKEKFINAFTSQEAGKENEFGIGWNALSRDQAEYVYEFWNKARTSAKEDPLKQPDNYPYNLCQNGEQPSAKPGTGPTVPEDPITGKTPPAQGAPPEEWAEYFDYYAQTKLPKQAVATYMGRTVINTVMKNRQTDGVVTLVAQLGTNAIKNCELPIVGSTPQEQLANLQQAALANGSSHAIGCTASVRIGDLTFIDGGPEDVKTIWVKPKNGVFANQAIGPIAIVDVASTNHLAGQYEKFGANYNLDIGYDLFKLIHSGYGAWNGPQEMIMCATKEQCEGLTFQ